jgi:hypothetical protein
MTDDLLVELRRIAKRLLARDEHRRGPFHITDEELRQFLRQSNPEMGNDQR